MPTEHTVPVRRILNGTFVLLGTLRVLFVFYEKSCMFYVHNVVIEIIELWIFLVCVFGFVATMPCCVVPGCTSGYGSNPERVHFFRIPTDPECEKISKNF